MARAVKFNSHDNVGTVIESVCKGEIITIFGKEGCLLDLEIVSINDIKFGHKIALVDIPAGHYIIKYGEIIGFTITSISQGEEVHIHNTESQRGRGDKVKG